ncbi:MAG: hypothetical protein EBR79_00010 [Proteobacteria bacterium]|nr:hypothetical protein [Pseudomonadota bacterium]
MMMALAAMLVTTPAALADYEIARTAEECDMPDSVEAVVTDVPIFGDVREATIVLMPSGKVSKTFMFRTGEPKDNLEDVLRAAWITGSRIWVGKSDYSSWVIVKGDKSVTCWATLPGTFPAPKPQGKKK